MPPTPTPPSKGSIDYSQGSRWNVDVYPWHYDNIYGYLWDHQKHRVKLNGFFNLKGDWNIAFDARWSPPPPGSRTRTGATTLEIPRGRHLLEPRGSREGHSDYQLDLQLSKGFTRLVCCGSC